MKLRKLAAIAALSACLVSGAEAANVTLVAPDQVTPIGATSANPLFCSVSGSGSSTTVVPTNITPTRTLVSVAASSTTLAAANATRRALQVACDGTSQVGLSQTGAALTANTLAGGADTVIPASSANAYIPPFATKSAVTAYGTSTAQNCVITEWSQ